MATNIPISLPSLPPFPSISKPRSHFSQSTHNSSLLYSSLSLSTASRKAIHFHNPFEINHQKKSNKLWITFATAEEFLPSDSIPLDNSQRIVSSTGDEGVATIIQALLFVAFLALTILTIGVSLLLKNCYFILLFPKLTSICDLNHGFSLNWSALNWIPG